MNKSLFSGCPGTMAELVQIEEARRASGFRNGYGQYVAAGRPGMEDGNKPGDKPGNPQDGRKKCPICGKLFFPAGKSQKYCCRDCREKGQLVNQKKRYQEKKTPVWMEKAVPQQTAVGACARCGKPIFYMNARNKPMKYCSAECLNAVRAERTREAMRGKGPAARMLICPICGKTFYSVCGNVKYCGPECAREGERIRGREYQRKEYQKRKREEAKHAGTGA